MKITGKKLMGAVLAGALLVGTLGGCANSEKAGGKSGPETISVWSGNRHSKNFYEKKVNEFNQGKGKELGITIDYQVKSDNYGQLVELALKNGDAPDFFGGIWATQKLVENKQIAAFDDLPGGPELLKSKQQYIIKGYNNFDGKTYNLPCGATTRGLLYNKDMFKAAGIVDEKGEPKPPATFEELRETAKKLTNPAEKKYGIILPLKWGGWFSSDIAHNMQSLAGFWNWSPTEGKYDYSSLVPVINAFLGIKEDGSYFPGAEGLDNDPARAQFATGSIGMKFGFSFDFGVLTSQFPATCDWGVAPLPVVDPAHCYKQLCAQGEGLCLNKAAFDAKDKAKLMEVYKFFNSDEFVRDAYREGLDLPLDWSTVEDIKLDSSMKQWQEFAEQLAISANTNREPKMDASLQFDAQKEFLEKVWPGTETPESFVKRFAEANMKAAEKYYEMHPDEDISEFNDPAWNIAR